MNRRAIGVGRRLIAMLAVPALAACLYIPTPPHGAIGDPISEAAIAALKPGETAREDVLLSFGDPAGRYEGDRYFYYTWQKVQGYLLVAYTEGAIIPDTIVLALEFGDDNRLRWVERLDPSLFTRPEEEIVEWIKLRSGADATP